MNKSIRPGPGAAWRCRLLLVCLVILVPGWLVGAVCAGGDHACDYLSKDEVAAVLGVAAAEGEAHPANQMGQSVCFFDAPTEMTMRLAQLQLVRSAWAKKAGTDWTAPALFDNNMSFLDNLREIPAVGERAYWGGSGLKFGAGLHVLFKDSYFTVQAATGDEQRNLQKAEELALVVLEKLK